MSGMSVCVRLIRRCWEHPGSLAWTRLMVLRVLSCTKFGQVVRTDVDLCGCSLCMLLQLLCYRVGTVAGLTPVWLLIAMARRMLRNGPWGLGIGQMRCAKCFGVYELH